MTHVYKLRGHIVKRLSHQEIGQISLYVFSWFFQKGMHEFNIERMIDLLSTKDISVHIVNNREWGKRHTWLKKGESIPSKKMISIPDRVFKAAIKGDHDAITTIFHELGHVVLQHEPIYHRAEIGAINNSDDAEEQADSFADFMMKLFNIPAPVQQLRLF